MNNVSAPDDGHRPGMAERLVHPLAVRYAVVFVAVILLLLADQAVIQPLLLRLNGYAPIINLAGRQRMLSQKIAKQSLALEFNVGETSAEARRRDLDRTLEQWSTAHRILRDGDPHQTVGPIGSGQIGSALRELEPDFTALHKAARQLAALGEDTDRANRESVGKPSPSRMELVRAVLDHEPDYLAGMEQVVGMLESAAGERVAWLRLCALAAVVLAVLLLASLYAFVVRPATSLIQRQLQLLSASEARHRALAEQLRIARDDLEQRVAERTSELSIANRALEQEMRHRHQVEIRMRRLSADLAQASRITALGQLATGLAHELNQPLGAIANFAGACELSLENALADDHPSRRAIGEVQRSALRAGAIVRRMRNFVRRNADQSSPVELNDLVKEVVELCDPELRRSGVELNLDLTCEPTTVVADPIRIQQVLVNLVQNAIQAMLENGGPGWLGIRTSLTEEGVQVNVADAGPGFSVDGGDDPFAAFYSTKADGLGMGLAISQSIIEQHQGRIWAANRPTRGAVVSFHLPFVATHDTRRRTAAHSLCG
ncbi:MAG TPA: ATP-binding protein [Pirellulales bacterium]|nr:ATP-binding protein [Pirellulales bacterium]